MRYTEKPITLLTLRWIGSEDEDPPFSAVEVRWKGQEVPFVLWVKWGSDATGDPQVSIGVTMRCDRGHRADEPIPLWREMRKAGVKFIGWPGYGDPAEDESD